MGGKTRTGNQTLGGNLHIRAVARAIAILRSFSAVTPESGTTELAKRLRLHKSTVHRLLVTLKHEGLVVQDPATGRYRLDLSLLELGSVVLDTLEAKRVVRPFLEDIHRACGETIHLAILDEGAVVYVDKIESSRRVRMYSQIGRRAPAHCTGLGKVLLAGLPDHLLSQAIDGRGLPAFTSKTITSPKELREHLALVRQQGYAIDTGEHEDLIRCVAAPVHDHTGQVVAAMSIAAIAVDVNTHRFREFIDLVRRNAQLASEAMGFNRSLINSKGDHP